MSWARSREITVWCDTPGCCTWETVAAGNVTKARQMLSSRGWSSKHPRDLCPSCVSKYRSHDESERTHRAAAGPP
jgi:hypothetical protein